MLFTRRQSDKLLPPHFNFALFSTLYGVYTEFWTHPGQTGERFGRSIDRIGVENFIAQLKSDDILERKQEILDAKLHLSGGATC